VVLARQEPFFVERLGEAEPTEVVAAALDEDGLGFLPEQPLDHGDVLVDELFLEIDCGCGDDDALFVFDRPGEGGDEVREGFPDSGARLGGEHGPFVESARHVAGESDLACARFIGVDQGGKLAAFFEHPCNLVLVEHDQGPAARRLGDDVDAADRVVDDIRTDAGRTGFGGDGDVRVARPERPRGMIVHDDVAALVVGCERGHGRIAAPGDDQHLGDAAVLAEAAGGEDLVAAVFFDFAP
jgi:hypothetical protein